MEELYLNYLKEIGCRDVNWIHLSQNMVQCRTLAKEVDLIGMQVAIIGRELLTG
jgi:hypothetical protein